MVKQIGSEIYGPDVILMSDKVEVPDWVQIVPSPDQEEIKWASYFKGKGAEFILAEFPLHLPTDHPVILNYPAEKLRKFYAELGPHCFRPYYVRDMSVFAVLDNEVPIPYQIGTGSCSVCSLGLIHKALTGRLTWSTDEALLALRPHFDFPVLEAIYRENDMIDTTEERLEFFKKTVVSLGLKLAGATQ